MTPGPIVLLCGENQLDKERRGYYRAFSGRASTHLISPGRDGSWIERVRAIRPTLVLNPDASAGVPGGLETLDAVTACFQIDTHVGTAERIRASMYYDYAFVFHPEFERAFRRSGHPGVRLLPHAAERDLFEGEDGERCYDVGWVGHTGLPIYRTRELTLRRLAQRFVTNDIGRAHPPEEMASVYKRSKVVVNVSRDDYPRDANMRCFEAMAAGALLITGTPTELTALGFVEGSHFVGYSAPDEALAIVERFLRLPDARSTIADRARQLVLREHTYDARVEHLLGVIGTGQSVAPARTWARGAR